MSYVSKDWQEHQQKRWMRPDAARWMRPDAARYVRHDAHRFAPPDQQWELKYSADQPRVPAGNPDGGQWTGDGDAGDSALVGGVLAGIGEGCELMHSQDLFICRLMQSPACYAQAYLRYSNCRAGRPIPPLNF
jgi:hypothetical protein